MRIQGRQSGFSLLEVLLAVGILAIGLVMIATVFPVGMKLTTLAAERTIAVNVADEAFAKIRLYGVDMEVLNTYQTEFDNSGDADYWDVSAGFWNVEEIHIAPVAGTDTNFHICDMAFAGGADRWYPSSEEDDYKYCWTGLVRRIDSHHVQVVVFVNRKMRNNAVFYDMHDVPTAGVYNDNPWPIPVRVDMEFDDTDAALTRVLTIDTDENDRWTSAVENFFDEDYRIVNNRTGEIYKLREYDRDNHAITLDREWDVDPAQVGSSSATEQIWVVPPGVDSRRYPCVGVFVRNMTF